MGLEELDDRRIRRDRADRWVDIQTKDTDHFLTVVHKRLIK